MSDLQDLIHKTSMDCLSKGKQQEQERIIKLLEDDLWHHLVPTQQVILQSGTYVSGKYHHAEDCLGCRQIALIKGEK